MAFVIVKMKVAVTTLAVCVAVLLSLGLVMLYSSGLYHKSGADLSSRFLLKQLLWCVVGLVACITAAALDYRLVKRWVWPLLGLAVLLLLWVQIKGRVVNGATRWLDLPGGIRFQPAELAKIQAELLAARDRQAASAATPAASSGAPSATAK